MTAVVPGGASTTAPARQPAAAERRGRTEISDRAVTKIACRAALEVPEVRDAYLGTSLWARRSGSRVRGGRATLKLTVSMAYPTPLHAVSARLREHVIRRVEQQTGLEVRRLDIVMDEIGGDLAWGS